ncbi:MAG: hypothetical protein N2505_00160 [Endomicrobia bacterium]|nr:hypothetical protein [Endomicrobiia bacterium]
MKKISVDFNIKNLDENIIRVLDKLQNKNHNLPINEDSITRLSYILDEEYFDLVLMAGKQYKRAITFYRKCLEIGLSLNDLKEMKLDYNKIDDISTVINIMKTAEIDKVKQLKFDIFTKHELELFFELIFYYSNLKNIIDNIIRFYPDKNAMFASIFTNDINTLNIIHENNKKIPKITENDNIYDAKYKIQWTICLIQNNVDLDFLNCDLSLSPRNKIQNLIENNKINPKILFNPKFLNFLELHEYPDSFVDELISDLKRNINVVPIICDIRTECFDRSKYRIIRNNILQKKLTSEIMALFLKYFEDATDRTPKEKQIFQLILNTCNNKIKSKLFFEYFNLSLNREKFSIFQAFLLANIKFLPKTGLKFNETKIFISL